MAEIHEDDLSFLINSFNEGVCCINAQGELLHYNSLAQTHWSIDRLHSHKLISQSPVVRALAGEHVYHELIHVDEQHALLVNTIPLYAGTNLVTSVVIISQNVSEHVSLERQAQAALKVLLEAALATHSTEDIDEALRHIAVLIPQLEGVDNSIAFRVDDTTERLIPLALFGSSQHSYDEWYAELTAIKLSTESALERSAPAYLHALRLARPLMFDFVSTSTYSNPRNLCAAIYAPVILDGHIVGLLGAERHQPPQDKGLYFPQWTVDLLTALARLASMSVEKNILLTLADRSQKDLEAVRKLLNQKDEFLLLATHELKNPLTAIRGQAQVAHRRLNQTLHLHKDDPQDRHDLLRGLGSIEHQTRKIEHMINTLLEVSRADLDRLELELQDFDLTQLVRTTLREYLPLTPNYELRLFVAGEPIPVDADDIGAHASIKVRGDEKRLEQVITNLVSNAIKYSPAGSPISVSLRHLDNEYVELSVEDQGIGIPVDEQGRLTERFYRAKNARASSAQGLGLGLYLVNTLIAKHGGSLSIISEGVPGKGSTFSVKLPSAEE